MNINDIDHPEKVPDKLKEIFHRQIELMTRYHHIEKAKGIGSGGILPEVFHIDDHRCQYVCKDFSWRITEELVEASTAIEPDHQMEELGDALHFYIELLIMVGIDEPYLKKYFLGPNWDKRIEGDVLDALFSRFTRSLVIEFVGYDPKISNDELFWKPVESLGLAMNCLKNKPWKETQMETDVPKFHRHLLHVLIGLVEIAETMGMSADDMYDIYFRKSEVNKFRQRSRY